MEKELGKDSERNFGSNCIRVNLNKRVEVYEINFYDYPEL